mgnify:FL=1
MDSWGKFIEGYLINNVHGDTTIVGAVDAAALIGADGTVWAATSGFALQTSTQIEVAKEDGTFEKTSIDERDHLLDALKFKGDTTKMKKGGVHFLGVKWIVLDGFSGEGYYTQYFKNQTGGAAVTVTGAGNLIIATWNSAKPATVIKDGVTKQTKQSVGFCNNAVDDLSKVLVQSGL